MKALKGATAKTLEGVASTGQESPVENHQANGDIESAMKIVGSMKQLKNETSADFTALEKEGLDRKTNHQEPRRSQGRRSRHFGETRHLFCLFTFLQLFTSFEKYHLCLSIATNSLWEALNVKAHTPDKFMDVSDMQVSDEDGF